MWGSLLPEERTGNRKPYGSITQTKRERPDGSAAIAVRYANGIRMTRYSVVVAVCGLFWRHKQMKTVIRLDKSDIEKIIAEKFDVPCESVNIKACSYVALSRGHVYEISCEIDKGYPSDISAWDGKKEFKLSIFNNV